MYSLTKHDQSLALGNTAIYSHLTDGLAGYWRFEEASYSGVADEVTDISGNSHHATALGGASIITGKLGNAVNLPNLAGYIDLPASTLGSTGIINPLAGTWTCWQKFNFTTGADWRLFNSTSSLGSGCEFRSYRYLTTTSWVIPFGSTIKEIYFFDLRPFDDQWVHLAATWEVIDGNTVAKSFVNGVMKHTQTWAYPAGISVPDTAISIGRWKTNYSNSLQVDEFLIYNRPLSLDEIEKIYNIGLGLAII